MQSITCENCGHQFANPSESPLKCPKCNQVTDSQLAGTIKLDGGSEADSRKVNAQDTANTINAGTARIPKDVDGNPDERTLAAGGMLPNIQEYSSTLKFRPSETPVAEFSTQIPSRGVAAIEERDKAADFQLEKNIGAGTFGDVYRAKQVALQRTVALKMLRFSELTSGGTVQAGSVSDVQKSKYLNEFLREAQFTGKLEHPNIVPVHDIGLIDGSDELKDRPFYVMKEIKGESWQTKIKHNSKTENLEILRQVANAVDYAHDKNILHCDLKPENVMLGEFGEVLVVDWGQAIDLTRPETIRPGGTPLYISPEMAKYWCDVFIEKKPTSPAINQLGPQSDVYLLGAILFEIVTGRPPHYGYSGDSAIDVMQHAIDNQIADYAEWIEDELLQIALCAMRVGDVDSFQTVSEFVEALDQNESRRVSIELRDRALDLLKAAEATDDYDLHGRARFGLEEAIDKWEGNETAKTSLERARLSCAELALRDQNYDLGISLLENAQSASEVNLVDRLSRRKAQRDRRKRLVGILSLAFILTAVGSGIWLSYAANEIVAKQGEIGELKTKANDLKNDLNNADEEFQQKLASKENEYKQELSDLENVQQMKMVKAKSEAQQKLAEEVSAVEKQAKLSIDKVKEQAILEINEANQKIADAKQNATQKIREANEERKAAQAEADAAESRNQLLKYKDEIVQISGRVKAGDFIDARRELENASEKLRSSIEWSRLMKMTHPESMEFFEPEKPIQYVSISADGRRLAVLSGGEVIVRDALSNETISSRQIPNAEVTALSADGKSLAVGIPRSANSKAGLFIFEGMQRAAIEVGSVPSVRLTDLQFSSDGNRLLCVGQVDKARKALGIEEELMVFERKAGQWERMDVRLTLGSKILKQDNPNRGTQPAFRNAEFSLDGGRILLASKMSNQLDPMTNQGHSIHVFELQSAGNSKQYRWIATAESNSIDAAAFADDNGSRVVFGETRDNTSALYQWTLLDPANENDAGTTIGFVSTSTDQQNFKLIGRLGDRIRSIDRAGNYVLTAGDDRKLLLWDLANLQLAEKFLGHSAAIDFCAIALEESMMPARLISVVTGANSQILRINLEDYQNSEETFDLQAQPERLFSNASLDFFDRTSRMVVGSDGGDVVVKDLRDDEPALEWSVSGWRKHVVTDQYLFGLSETGEIFQYEVSSGELIRVLNEIGIQNRPHQITSFFVSSNGETALVETDSDLLEFQIWNLVQQKMVKRISYDSLVSSSSEKLPTVRLSDSGDYVVAGKNGFAVWNTLPGSDQPIFAKFGSRRDFDWPLDPLNNIVFYSTGNGTSEFLVSWPEARGRQTNSLTGEGDARRGGRIHAYEKKGDVVKLIGRFRPKITQGAFDTGLKSIEPNMFDARVIDGKRYVLVRASDGVQLLQLDPEQIDKNLNSDKWNDFKKVASFKRANFANFSQSSDDVLLLSPLNSPPVQRWNLGKQQLEDLILLPQVRRWLPEFPSSQLSAIFENSNGELLLQALTRSPQDGLTKDFNTLSLQKDFSIGSLRLIANPVVGEVAGTSDTIFTLDSRRLQRWKVSMGVNGVKKVSPAGVIPGIFEEFKLSPDGHYLMAYEAGIERVQIFNAMTGDLLSEIDGLGDAGVSAIAIANGGRFIAVGFDNGDLKIGSMADGNFFWVEEAVSKLKSEINSLSFAAENDSLFATLKNGTEGGLADSYAYVFHKQEGSQNWNPIVVGYPQGQQQIVIGDLSPNGQRLVTGTRSGRIDLWNVESVKKTGLGQIDLSQVEQRGLVELGRYSSEVRVLRFAVRPDDSETVDLLSADRGDFNEIKNDIELWRMSSN